MTDYWKSNAKYLCKYCNIYIADEINQRRQHEEGLRHKGNVDKYIKDLYKRGAQQKKDKEEEAREMKRIDAAAHAAMGTRPVASSSGTGEPAAKKQRFTASMSTYSSAASLGLAPDDDEPFFAPGQRRTDQGEAGDWQVVRPTSSTSARLVEESDRVEEEEEEMPTHRTLRERTAVFDDDLYDPGEIRLKRRPGEARVKKEETPSEEPAPRATFRPIRFGVKEEPRASLPVEEPSTTTEEPVLAEAKEEEKPIVKEEIKQQPEAGLFKKKKRKMIV